MIQADWTWLIYLATANNVADAGAVVLARIGSIAHDPRIRVVVQQATPTGSQRHVLGTPPERIDLGKVDSGDPATLRDFVAWGTATAPAARYALVIWSHGSGWEPHEIAGVAQRGGVVLPAAELSERASDSEGRQVLFSSTMQTLVTQPTANERAIAFDDGSGHSIDTVELGNVMGTIRDALGRPLDLLVLNACQMASVEVATQLRGSVVALVASQEDMPVQSLPYDAILPQLAQDPTQDAVTLAAMLVARYRAYFDTHPLPWAQSGMPPGVTLTAVRPDSFAPLLAAMRALATALHAALPGAVAALWHAHFSQAHAFKFRQYDLRSLADGLATHPQAPAAVVAAAQQVALALADPQLLIAHDAMPVYAKTGGLSVHLMRVRKGVLPPPSKFYGETAFAAATGWMDLLLAYQQAAPASLVQTPASPIQTQQDAPAPASLVQTQHAASLGTAEDAVPDATPTDLRIDVTEVTALADGRVQLRVAAEGGAPGGVLVRYDGGQLRITLAQLADRSIDRAGLVALGRALADLLLSGGARERLVAHLAQPGATPLRLILRLEPAAAALPWEYLYIDRAGGGDGVDGFLALDPAITIVRREPGLPVQTGALPPGPVDVLVALAAPADLPPLDLARERADLEAAFAGRAGLNAIFLDAATLAAVQERAVHAEIFHFAGHGMFEEQAGALPGQVLGGGSLALADQRVDAEQLGINLRGTGTRLALLGACESARRDGISPWSGVAPALAKAGIAAVLAYQFPVRDDCAIAFSRAFYGALVGGLALERAVTAGRIAAYNVDPQGRDWGIAALLLQRDDALVFAAPAAAQEPARKEAHAIIRARAEHVAAGGQLVGASVGRVAKGGTLAVEVEVGTVAGEVIGARTGAITAGTVDATVTAGTVQHGGSVTGAVIDEI